MSIERALQEGRAAFVAESRELLEQMESTLLALESQPGDAELLNALFRAAHTVKGSAGIFGLDRIVGFTHVLESVFDRVRSGKQALDATLTEIALRSADHLGHLIDRIGAGEPDDVEDGALAQADIELLGALAAWQSDGAPGPSPAPATDRMAARLLEDESDASATGPLVQRTTWHLSVRFGRDVLRNGMDPLSFVRYLGRLGRIDRLLTVVDHLPAPGAFDAESCYLGLEMLFDTTADEPTIADAFDLVRDDCRLAIFPPRATIAAYAARAEDWTEAPERASALWREVGALTDDELAAVRADAPAAPTLLDGARAGDASSAALESPTTVVPPPALAPAKAPPATADAARFIRVQADKLDRLITLVGELVIAGSASSALAHSRGDRALQEAASAVDSLVEEVREGALRLRMVQVGETFRRFDRVVRDVSRALGKQIALVVTGGDTELDKSVVERINDPLTHLVRNAIDHGLEDRDGRARAGKPDRGTVHLHAYHDSGSVVIEVSDDGRGLDRNKLLAKGREKGLIGADQTLTDREILNLVFEPGFSTAAAVTNLSGRGVGMDVVRRNIHDLRGSVSLSSVPGRGTTVTIRLPLTLAIIEGFLVRVGAHGYVVPLDMVHECIELPAAARTQPPGGDLLNLRGQVLPLIRLRDLYSTGGAPGPRQNVVVLRVADQRVGLVVDQLLGERQTVIKPLGKLFAAVPGIGGSTVLGNGEVALILDVPSLIRFARAQGLRRTPRPRSGASASSETQTKVIS